MRKTPRETTASPRPFVEAVEVMRVLWLDGRLRALQATLQQALGPAYRVVDGGAGAEATVAVLAPDLERLAELRARRPDLVIVVYGADHGDAARYLDAGADDLVAAASSLELAARVRAGVRRRGWQRAGR